MITVTTFSNVNDSRNPIYENIDDVLERIRTGGDIKNKILEIAAIEDKSVRSERKLKELPAVCFNGTFNRRSIDGLDTHNGFMVIDIDGLDTEDKLQKKRKEICSLPYVYTCFISPSYKGIKALVKIPVIDEGKFTDITFKEYFAAFSSEIQGIDKSGKDISRACFFSYDPNIYINKNAIEYTNRVSIEKEVVDLSGIQIPKFNGTSEPYCLQKVYEIISSAQDGERHSKLMAASVLAGGFISANRVDENEISNVMLDAFSLRPYDNHYKPMKTISDGISYGVKRPLINTYNKMKDKQEQPYTIHPQLVQDNIETSKKTAGELMYVPFVSFEKEADELYELGNPRGIDSRFPSAREFISYKSGYTTYIYSAPHSGKTQFAMSELCYLAERYGNKIAVYSKEIGEPKDVLAEVASIYIGKLYNHHDHTLRMSETEKKKAKEFFKKHFYVIDPIYNRQTIDVTIDAILDAVKDIERIEGIHIDNVYIDPLSEVDDGGDERIDRFIKKVNKMINDDARLNDRHNFLISHVRDQSPIVDKESGTSWFPMPTPREISGGQNSYKQGYQLICVYRPSPNRIDKETGVPFLKNETHIDIQKSRPKGIGRMGMFKLYFDWKTNRYYENPDLVYYPPVFDNQPKEEIDIFAEQKTNNFWEVSEEEAF